MFVVIVTSEGFARAYGPYPTKADAFKASRNFKTRWPSHTVLVRKLTADKATGTTESAA